MLVKFCIFLFHFYRILTFFINMGLDKLGRRPETFAFSEMKKFCNFVS